MVVRRGVSANATHAGTFEACNCRKLGDNCRNTHDDQEYVHVSTSTCLYDKLKHSYVSCQHLNHNSLCLWALQNVFLMWMDSDGTC